MNEQIDINFKPSAIYNILKIILYSIIIYTLVYLLNEYLGFNNKIFYTYTNENSNISFDTWNIGNLLVLIISIKEVLSILHIKLFNNYHLTSRNITVRSGLFNNKISLPLNGRLITETQQSIIQLLVGLVDITLEADGDSSQPEAILKNVSPKYFDMINELKEGRY